MIEPTSAEDEVPTRLRHRFHSRWLAIAPDHGRGIQIPGLGSPATLSAEPSSHTGNAISSKPASIIKGGSKTKYNLRERQNPQDLYT